MLRVKKSFRQLLPVLLIGSAISGSMFLALVLLGRKEGAQNRSAVPVRSAHESEPNSIAEIGARNSQSNSEGPQRPSPDPALSKLLEDLKKALGDVPHTAVTKGTFWSATAKRLVSQHDARAALLRIVELISADGDLADELVAFALDSRADAGLRELCIYALSYSNPATDLSKKLLAKISSEDDVWVRAAALQAALTYTLLSNDDTAGTTFDGGPSFVAKKDVIRRDDAVLPKLLSLVGDPSVEDPIRARALVALGNVEFSDFRRALQQWLSLEENAFLREVAEVSHDLRRPVRDAFEDPEMEIALHLTELKSRSPAEIVSMATGLWSSVTIQEQRNIVWALSQIAANPETDEGLVATICDFSKHLWPGNGDSVTRVQVVQMLAMAGRSVDALALCDLEKDLGFRKFLREVAQACFNNANR